MWHAGEGISAGDLKPSQRLRSLSARRMGIHAMESFPVSLSVSMPRLEELSLPETPEMFAPWVSGAAAVGVGPPRGAPPFPAVRRLNVATTRLVLDPSAGVCL